MTDEVADGNVYGMDYIFRACRCYVWPLWPYASIARCGGCGYRPDLAVEPTATGAAMPITEYILTSQRRK